MNSVAVYRFVKGTIDRENKKHKQQVALPPLYICKKNSYVKPGRVGEDKVHEVSDVWGGWLLVGPLKAHTLLHTV